MRALASLLAGLIILAAASLVAAGPEGQITWAEHTTLVPAWLDPGEAMNLTGALYALHDALVKPMPGGSLTPSLAESWSMSPDGLVYDFVLRKGVRFHNGEPVTAEDVKFSFERYRGGFASVLKDHVARVETVNPGRVRIRLTDTGERLRPSNVWFSASSRTTRHARAALKRGEVDIAYFLAAEDIRRTPGFMVKATLPSTHWLYFLDQWDPKSPWHDRRVRLAANYAIDRHTINRALTRGLSRITWSFVHSTFDLYWQPPPYPYDATQARQLLVEAGYPNGFDAGTLFCDVQATTLAEALVNDLKAIGVRTQLRPLERAAFSTDLQRRS